MTRPTKQPARVRARVHALASLPLPDVTNHHRSLMTDVTGRIRAGGMNYGVRVRWKSIYLSEDPKREAISRRSASRDAAKPGAGNMSG